MECVFILYVESYSKQPENCYKNMILFNFKQFLIRVKLNSYTGYKVLSTFIMTKLCTACRTIVSGRDGKCLITMETKPSAPPSISVASNSPEKKG